MRYLYAALLSGFELFKEAAAIRGLSTAGGLAFVVPAAFRWGVDGAVLGLLATQILMSGAFAWRAHRQIHRAGISVTFVNCWEEWKCIRDFALPLGVAGGIVMASTWFAQILLVQQPGGYDHMGAYQASNQWRTMVAFLPTLLIAAYLPILSTLLNSDRLGLRQLQNRIFASLTILTLVLALPIIFFAPWLMRLYGEAFTAFWPILVVVAVIPVFDIGNLVLRNTAIAHGYAWTLIVAHLAMATSVILCGVWLIPKYLGVGLALSLLAGYASLLFVQYCFYRGRS